MKVALHRIGNSQGVILPKALLAQVGFTENGCWGATEQKTGIRSLVVAD
jgi:hypothetical protein